MIILLGGLVFREEKKWMLPAEHFLRKTRPRSKKAIFWMNGSTLILVGKNHATLRK